MSSLITLPIRLPLEITWRAAKLGVEVLKSVTALLEHDDEDTRVEPVEDLVAEPAAVETMPAAAVEAMPPSPEPVFAPTPPPPGPPHVDSEPELAYEAGPADDVGAEIHVDQPWDGYDRMRAADIVDRLRAADEATRAVVRLYEQRGKARSSVLAATA
jgi:hypothetical protein